MYTCISLWFILEHEWTRKITCGVQQKSITEYIITFHSCLVMHKYIVQISNIHIITSPSCSCQTLVVMYWECTKEMGMTLNTLHDHFFTFAGEQSYFVGSELEEPLWLLTPCTNHTPQKNTYIYVCTMTVSSLSQTSELEVVSCPETNSLKEASLQSAPITCVVMSIAIDTQVCTLICRPKSCIFGHNKWRKPCTHIYQGYACKGDGKSHLIFNWFHQVTAIDMHPT